MKRRLIEFLILLMVALGAGPVGAAMWQWSLTSGNNATADPSINWAEGQSPSSVNDSARAMMSVLAAWRNDISAVNTTSGTSSAYTLTTSEGVNTTPADGQMLSFIVHATNAASATLTADTGNTYPLWLNGAPVAAGTVVIGTPYRVAFSLANSAWLLEAGFGNPYGIPLGGLLASTSATAPNSSFIEPAGQCISTTTYAAYWVQQGSPASGSCSGGQFAIIDLRGRVPVPLDTLNSSAAGRLTSSTSGCGTAMTSIGAICANGTEGKTLTSAQLPASIPFTDPGHSHTMTARLGNSATFGSIALGGSSDNGPYSGITAAVATTGITINPGGGSAHSIIPPMIGVKYYLRVL